MLAGYIVGGNTARASTGSEKVAMTAPGGGLVVSWVGWHGRTHARMWVVMLVGLIMSDGGGGGGCRYPRDTQ